MGSDSVAGTCIRPNSRDTWDFQTSYRMPEPKRSAFIKGLRDLQKQRFHLFIHLDSVNNEQTRDLSDGKQGYAEVINSCLRSDVSFDV